MLVLIDTCHSSEYPFPIWSFFKQIAQAGHSVRWSSVGIVLFDIHVMQSTFFQQNIEVYELSTHNGPTCKTNHSSLMTVVEFVYTGNTQVTVENVEGVLSLAIHFQVSYKSVFFSKFLFKSLSH